MFVCCPGPPALSCQRAGLFVGKSLTGFQIPNWIVTAGFGSGPGGGG